MLMEQVKILALNLFYNFVSTSVLLPKLLEFTLKKNDYNIN